MTTTERAAGRRRLPGVPARVRILGWLMLLMIVVLATAAVVTRNLLLRQVNDHVNTALAQEAREFSQVAEGGVDRATNRPIRSARELLSNHLQRQVPDDDEVLVGWVGGADGGEVLRQTRSAPFELGAHPDLLDSILRAGQPHGSMPTPEGEMRWYRVIVDDPSDTQQRGALVIGYFVDRDRAEVANTIETFAAVGLVGLVLAGGAAWLVAGQILAPVRVIRRAAEQITEQDLTRRIPLDGHDELAALTEQFNAMLDRLELAFGTQRQFLDDAGHELRTPITIIRGHLELLEVSADPAERAAVVRLCLDELDRMARIVADLLLLAKSERPDFVQPGPAELAELTSDIDAKVRALGDRRWRLESIAEGRVVLDQQRVTQAVVQLAQNAVQHTGPGDTITFGSSHGAGSVSFWITDTGPGVPAADEQVVFDRFSRGRNGHRDRGGAGLGLAIVKAIATAHGGTVRLVSTPGEGATFGIELPAQEVP